MTTCNHVTSACPLLRAVLSAAAAYQVRHSLFDNVDIQTPAYLAENVHQVSAMLHAASTSTC